MELNKNETKTKNLEKACSAVLQRVNSVDDIMSFYSPNMSESDSDRSLKTVFTEQGAKRRRQEVVKGDGMPLPKVTTAHRGRGRSSATGVTTLHKEALRELQKLESEEEFEDISRKRRQTATSFLKKWKAREDAVASQVQSCDFKEIGNILDSTMDLVRYISTKSKNLNGPFKSSLQEAAEVGKAVVEVLRSRSTSEEMRLLTDTNTRLSVELEMLRREVAELRNSRAQLTKIHPPSEELMQTVMVQVGTMIDARFAGLEERLLPEKRLRPPLAADLRREAISRTATSSGSTVIATEPKTSPAENKRTKKAKKDKVTAPTESTVPHPLIREEPWTLVARKSRGKKLKKADSQPRAASRSIAPPRLQTVKTTNQVQPTVARVPKIRPPKTAAVVITLHPDAAEKGITYAKVIAEAKSRVNLQTLGVASNVKMRTAATGAKLIEISGAQKVDQADSLAAKLNEVFTGSDMVQISRPVTMAEIRVSGLDDSVTTDELVEAIARAGDCKVETVKTGQIRVGTAGMGTAFVRCPITAAKQIVDSGRLLVGWVSAQVKALEPRPRRCYRCQGYGHIHAKCKAEVDRSNECRRCGQNGHKASGCSAAPHCTLCAAAGKAADHLCGGKACAKPPVKRMRRNMTATEVKAKSQPIRSELEQVIVMEES